MKRVRTVFTGVAGTPWYSNIYFDDVSPAVDAVEAVTAAWANLTGSMSQLIDGVVEGQVPTIDPVTGEITSWESVPPGAANGTGTGEMLPAANQGLVRFFTGGVVAGRRVQGKVFLPGLLETQSQDGVPAASLLANAQNFANDLVAAGDATMVVWSRPTLVTDLPIPVPRLGSEHVVLSATVAPFFAVLRSRRD